MPQIIDPKSTNPEEILLQYQEYIKSKPDDQAWVDFFTGGAGQTVLEVISGLASFDAYNANMVRRESSLGTAVLETSIVEHAFNKGVLVGPSQTLEIELTVNAGDNTLTINETDVLGTIGDYEVYSTEVKVSSGVFTIKAAVGILNTHSISFASTKFKKLAFNLAHKYPATTFEKLTLGTTDISLKSGVDFKDSIDGNFLLRRVLDSQVEIFISNGILGYYNESDRLAEYRVLTYDTNLSEVNINDISLIINAEMESARTLVSPVFGIPKETLRGIATYFPADARIVKDRDYETGILKEFGGIVQDVYSFNTDPNQKVYMLKNESYLSSTNLPQIKMFVDSKRGSGIFVQYEEIDMSSGLTLGLDLSVDSTERYVKSLSLIEGYLDTLKNKFSRIEKTITAYDIATDLTARFNIRFNVKTPDSITLTSTDFIKSFNLSVNI